MYPDQQYYPIPLYAFHLLRLPSPRLLPTLRLHHSLRHNTPRIHLPKALDLLRQTTVTSLWPPDAANFQHSALKSPIELLDESLPPIRWFAIGQMRKDPLSLFLDVWFDDFAEADRRVAADLLYRALV